jgi:general secretion pathway protein M
MNAALQSFWSERNPREQRLLLLAGLFLALVILYQLLWDPAASGRARLHDALPQMQSELANMNAQAERARSLKAAATATPTGAAWLDGLRSSLAQQGLNGAQLSENGSLLQLHVTGAPFERCVAWLDNARRIYKVQVIDAQVNALPQPGMVSLTATLQGGTR